MTKPTIHMFYLATLIIIFILFLPPSPTVQSQPSEIDCATPLDPQLEIGTYVRSLNPESIKLFSGMPYTDYTDNHIMEITNSAWRPADNVPILVVEGPVCYGGNWMWRVQPSITSFAIEIDNEQTYPGENLWLFETMDGEVQLIPAEKTATIQQFIWRKGLLDETIQITVDIEAKLIELLTA